jgi:hypothetical protein
MSKNLIIAISVLVLGGIAILSGAGFYFSTNRAEVTARNACEAQLGNIENVLDNMWKNFQEIGGIADRERDTAMAMFREYAEARTVEGQGAMMAWITEQVPNADPAIYLDLQARLTAGRQEYRGAQTYMLELVRAHTNIVEDPFKKFFISETEPFEFTVISSSATKEAVATGQDERTFTLPSRD